MKMNRVVIVLVVAFFSIGLLGCQNDQDSEEVEEKEAPFFYQIETDQSTVYMLGSIHVGSEDMYPLDQTVEDAYTESDALVVEANVLEATSLANDMLMKAMYTDGTTLSEHISSDTYQKLIDYLDSHDQQLLNTEMISYMEPWVIEMLLSDIQLSKLDTLTAEHGVDYYFLSKAEAEQKEILELEGMQAQLDFLDSTPEDLQIYALEEMLDSVEEEANLEELNYLVEAWKTGEEERLEEVLNVSVDSDLAEQYSDYQQQLLDDRNRGMVSKIEKYLSNGTKDTYFVIVGAAHFTGETGLDNLLEEKGFDVQPFSEM